jgi:hypothetical protein
LLACCPAGVPDFYQDSDRVTYEKSTSENDSYLAQSHHGSPRHLRSCAQNALTVVSQLNKPTLFITVTCNTHWPEITQALFPGQTAYDRPDIVVQVFKARLSALMHNIRHGKYFGGQKSTYSMYVIEWQHRGLPHSHIVIQLEGEWYKKETADVIKDLIDVHISATLPITTAESSPQDLEYFQLVDKNLRHKCYSKSSGGCLDSDGVCKRGYDEVTIDTTSFNDRGFPVYKRPTPADVKIVPHNREILLDWQGHVNVEYCASTYTVLYLYSYLFKVSRIYILVS